MNPRICDRKWQAEAVHDGRLSGDDVTRFRRHQRHCPECTAEGRALAELGQRIAQVPELARDPMLARRSRQALLRSLNGSAIDPQPPRLFTRAVFACALVGMLIAAGWLNARRSIVLTEPRADLASSIEVHAEASARWTEQIGPVLDELRFSEGSASFKVRAHPGRRVLIRLPDGELEDIGTAFQISVTQSHTERVSVSDGRVSLRLRGVPEFSLLAGESWENGRRAAPTSRTPSALVSAPESSAHFRPEPASSTGASAVRASVSSAGSAHREPAAGRKVDEGSSERAPETNGEPPKVAGSATDARLEDASYLQIIQLLKEGQYDRARREAKRYLLRFPNGFRRVEVLNSLTQADK